MSEAARPLPERVPVLVVDDDEIVRTWLSHTLRDTEFYVAAEVSSVADAHEYLEAEGAGLGLLLVDYRLPDGTGVDLMRKVRERGVATPAVLMTAGTEIGLNQTALAAGFQGAYVKSGRRDPLLEALRLVREGSPSFDHRHPKAELNGLPLADEDRRVLDLVTRGFSLEELAERTGITAEEARATFERASAKIQRRQQDREPAPVPEETPRATPQPLLAAPRDLAFSERAAVLAAFLRSVHETMAAVQDEVCRLTATEPDTLSGAALAAHAHLLKGGAATAGLEDVAALAAQLEATTRGTGLLDSDEIRRVSVLVRELGVRVDRLPAVDAVGLRPESTRPRTNGSPPIATVVYIDDEPASLMLVDVLLAREPGFRLVTARSGQAGIRAVADESPDLVFLDLRLPDFDGLDVLERLRELDGGEGLPVVLLTGEANDRLDSLQQQADLVLTKPLDLGRFFEVVALLREEAEAA
jgi:DNA-binding NarL/FixJ family response regulator